MTIGEAGMTIGEAAYGPVDGTSYGLLELSMKSRRFDAGAWISAPTQG